MIDTEWKNIASDMVCECMESALCADQGMQAEAETIHWGLDHPSTLQ